MAMTVKELIEKLSEQVAAGCGDFRVLDTDGCPVIGVTPNPGVVYIEASSFPLY